MPFIFLAINLRLKIMQKLTILFLGAAKRVTLFERFLDAANKLSIDLQILSCEKEHDFYPISHLATILPAPLFTSPEFQPWLTKTIQKHAIDIVIPAIDPAIIALSQFRTTQTSQKKPWIIVSADYLSKTMGDKVLAEAFFN